MDKQLKIFIPGSREMIGRAIIKKINQKGDYTIIGAGSDEPELTEPMAVKSFFVQEKPDYVIYAAGKSGGIAANQKYPADLMLNNLTIECNIIHAAFEHKVKKLLYLASSCCYPKRCPQPMKEEYLFTGPLEPTNQAYATAKSAGIVLCQAYRDQYGAPFFSGIPANCFGPEDDFSLDGAHVIGALINRMHNAKLKNKDSVTIWGTGKPQREFIYSEDLARAALYTLINYDGDTPINLGSGTALSIAELAKMIRKVTNFPGKLVFDTGKPDGMPIKLLDSQKLLDLGWKPEDSIEKGLKKTYAWYLKQPRPSEPNKIL